MIGAAARGAILVLAGVAAAHFLFPQQTAASGDAAQLTQLSQRLDALQRSLDALAATRILQTSAATTGQVVQPPAAPTKPETSIDTAGDARAEALRAGNAIVDRALQSARWTIDDVASLATATASLSGADRSEIRSRLSAAINQDKLQVEPRAMAF
jgi:hypothetical protein